MKFKNISKANLSDIFKRELSYLEDGVLNIKNPFHFFTLSTINKNVSELRTIVLRKVETDSFKLFFNADLRSPKINQLKNSQFCSLLFYDNKRKVQIRLKAKPTVFYNDDNARKIWDETPLQSRKCYMGRYNPSKIIDKYHPNIPLKYLKTDPEEKDSMIGYNNFSYIELKVLDADILELHHDGHIRFNINFITNNINFVSP